MAGDFQESVRVLWQVLEQAAERVVVTDNRGIILYVNAAFEKLTGYTRLETLGKTPAILKSGLHTPEFYQQLWSKLQGGEVFSAEFINKNKKGRLYREKQTISPVRGASGEITHFISTASPLTTQQIAEADINRLKTEMASLNRLMLGREDRVVELKQEVNALLGELGRSLKYVL